MAATACNLFCFKDTRISMGASQSFDEHFLLLTEKRTRNIGNFRVHRKTLSPHGQFHDMSCDEQNIVFKWVIILSRDTHILHRRLYKMLEDTGIPMMIHTPNLHGATPGSYIFRKKV